MPGWTLKLPDFDEALSVYHDEDHGPDNPLPDELACAIISDSRWTDFAKVYVVVNGYLDDDGIAKARLMTASPDLLAACKSAASLLRKLGGENHNPEYAELLAAIAKAEPPQ